MAALPAIPAIAALLVLSGWIWQVESLKRLGLTSVTMNPTTAIGFLMLSSGLLISRRGRGWTAVAGKVLLSATALLGILKLLDLATGNWLSLDSLLFRSQTEAQAGGPSRMALNVAIDFALLGSAALLPQTRARHAIALSQGLAMVAMVVAGFAVLGYLYGVAMLYRVSVSFPMALHSALSFAILSASILIETRSRGLLTPISGAGPGGRTARLLLPIGLAVPVTAGWLRQMGEKNGMFGNELGVALLVTVSMLTFTFAVWWNAHKLMLSDRSRCAAEEELHRAATHDSLTGLANRALFMERLLSRLTSFRRRNAEMFGVIYIDLDGFKQVNDRLGHDAGDRLLCDMSKRLLECVRADDLVARMGGDEFTILLDRIAGSEDVSFIAGRILEGMPTLVGPPHCLVPVGMSLGIVVAESRHMTPESLLTEADTALYASKRSGKGCASVFATDRGVVRI